MTDDGRCMDVNIIFHDYSTHARYMRINSVEITDMSIMCNDGIGLYHIIVAHALLPQKLPYRYLEHLLPL